MIPLVSVRNAITTIDMAGVPATKRFTYWSEVICRNFAPAENRTHVASDAFRASLRGRAMGPIGITRIMSTPMISSRTTQSIRREPLDCFFVSLLEAGSAHMTQSGRQVVQRAGDFMMYDSAQPFVYDMTDVYKGLWLRLPRQVVASRMANPDILTGRIVSVESPLGKLGAAILQQAADMELAGDGPAAARVATSIVDILAAAFETEAGMDLNENPRHVNLLDRAKSHILANLDDPDLDTDSLVDVLGVSRRTLNRLFAREGTTPIRWLWQQRLERGRVMLESGAKARVTDVALSCGFSDFSHFSRAFKTEFGLSPKALLVRQD
jgi:AraC-like DNA-binding protein